MKRKRIAYILVGFLLMVFTGIYFYYGFLYKEARNIESEVPDLEVTTTKLFTDYTTNPQKADSIYLNKTIEITGRITKETDSVIMLENAVFCRFTQKTKMKLMNSKVTIKGKCIGYDELFQEVKLDQCTTTINK